MPDRLICPQGHQWELPPTSHPPKAGELVDCPICGAAVPVAELNAPATRLSDAVTMPPGTPPAAVSTPGPATVAGYEIVRELGRGGMGVVYQARQTRLNRLVALKMILGGGHAGPQDLARFRREAEAVASLQHPNIVQIYEIGEHHGLPFFSLEFVDGDSLDRKLNGKPLPFAQAASLVETLARAVHAAHQRGIIHRDLKPGNVLLARTENSQGVLLGGSAAAPVHYEPKIADFGLAKRVADVSPNPDSPASAAVRPAAALTQSGAIIGTPSYMAPEQAGGKTHAIGPAVDVYALGAMLYEMLTGRPPFLGTTSADTLLQVLSAEPVAPRRLQPKLARDLETICLKCLRKEPERRYPSALALAEDLERLSAGAPIEARPVGLGERVVKWARRRPAAAALAVVCAVALPGLVGLVLALWYHAELRASTAQELVETQLTLNAAQQQLTAARQQTSDLQRQADAKRAEVNRLEKVHGQELARAAAARRDTEQAEQEARQNQYITRIALAERYWAANQVDLVEQNLSQCPLDLRHWEWNHLKRLCHAELRRVQGPLATGAGPVVLSPDGQRVAAVCSSRRGGKLAITVWTIKVWDTGDGREIHDLGDFELAKPRALAFSADGRRLAAGGDDRAVTIWDTDKGVVQFTLAGLRGPVYALVLSVDGKRLATAGEDRTIKLWDGQNGKELYTLRGHTQEVNGLAFRPDGNRLASASSDGTIKIWDTNPADKGAPLVARRELVTLAGHRGQVLGVTYSPDGQRLISTGGDNMVKVWDLAARKELFSLRGHNGLANQAVFSRDGSRLATAGEDRTVRVWDGRDGKRLFTLRGHAAGVQGVAFNGDGRQLWSVSTDQVCMTWDARNGRQGLQFPSGHSCLAFSPDGRSIVTTSASQEGTITVWDAVTGRQRISLGGHKGKVRWAAFQPGGQRMVTAAISPDSNHALEVWVWDLSSGKSFPYRTLASNEVSQAALSDDGRRIAWLEKGKGIRVFDVATGQIVGRWRKLVAGDAVENLAFSPAGQFLAVAYSSRFGLLGTPHLIRVCHAETGKVVAECLGPKEVVHGLAFRQGQNPAEDDLLAIASDDRTVSVWVVPRKPTGSASLGNWRSLLGKPLYRLAGHTQAVRAVVFSGDGKRLASVSGGAEPGRGEVKLWDMATGQEVRTLELAGTAVAFSPDGWRLAIAGADGRVRVLDGSPTRELLIIRDAGPTVAYRPDGQLLATGGPDADITIYDARTARKRRTLAGQPAGNPQGHSMPVRRIVFSPTDRLLASAGGDGLVKIWDTNTGKVVHTCTGHDDAVFGLAFNPDGTRLASAGTDETVQVWNVRTGRQIVTLRGHDERVLCVAFQPDGKRLASGAEDKCVRIFDLKTRREVMRLVGHDGFVNAVAYSPDGRLLASASDDGKVRIWDTTNGKLVRTYSGHADSVRDVAFSLDGKRLATAGWDRVIKIWEVASGKEILNLTGHGGGVTAVAFGAGQGRLASAGADMTVRIWDTKDKP